MKSKALTTVGLLMLLAAALLTLWNVREGDRAAQTAEFARNSVEQALAAETAQTVSPEETEVSLPDPARSMPTVEADGNIYIGTLEIPGLGLELPVLSEWSDTLLKTAPCRYAGSAYLDSMVIAGHNYRRHFGGLRNLQAGDNVIFTDTEGLCFSYAVTLVEQLPGDAVEEMTSGEWDLTLFTCTTGGLERVTVRCRRVEVKQPPPACEPNANIADALHHD